MWTAKFQLTDEDEDYRIYRAIASTPAAADIVIDFGGFFTSASNGHVTVRECDIQGATANRFGSATLRELMLAFQVFLGGQPLTIYTSRRTTGANPGKRSTFRLP